MQAKGLLSEYQPKFNSAKAVYREQKKYVDEIDWNMLAVPPTGSYKAVHFFISFSFSFFPNGPFVLFFLFLFSVPHLCFFFIAVDIDDAYSLYHQRAQSLLFFVVEVAYAICLTLFAANLHYPFLAFFLFRNSGDYIEMYHWL